jgi:hypothetical protein
VVIDHEVDSACGCICCEGIRDLTIENRFDKLEIRFGCQPFGDGFKIGVVVRLALGSAAACAGSLLRSDGSADVCEMQCCAAGTGNRSRGWQGMFTQHRTVERHQNRTIHTLLLSGYGS